jgi:hypothetical protein
MGRRRLGRRFIGVCDNNCRGIATWNRNILFEIIVIVLPIISNRNRRRYGVIYMRVAKGFGRKKQVGVDRQWPGCDTGWDAIFQQGFDSHMLLWRNEKLWSMQLDLAILI